MTLTGGILEGTGTVAANLTNGGEVRPGTSPGTLAVDGAYTQTAAGVLVAEITASGHDLLDATGAATLDGTLEVETAAGFTPSVGDTFKVVEGASRTGEFADVNGIGSGPYEVLYEADGSACRRRPERSAGTVDRRRHRARGRVRLGRRGLPGAAIGTAELRGHRRLPDRQRHRPRSR